MAAVLVEDVGTPSLLLLLLFWELLLLFSWRSETVLLLLLEVVVVVLAFSVRLLVLDEPFRVVFVL